MSKIVNLRQVRKRKARDDARKAGDANAAAHGRSKAERAETDARRELEERRLDGAKRDDTDA